LHFEADGYVGSIITNWLSRHGSVAVMMCGQTYRKHQ